MSSVQNINPVVWKIPYGVKANCYLFALAPKLGIGGYANRPYKSTPGQKCEMFKNKRINFNNCDELDKRIICDNPDIVKKIATEDRFDNFGSNHHVMCSLLSPGGSNSRTDFHFLRRISYNTFMKSYDQFVINMSLKCKEQVDNLKPQDTRWIWAHQRGWSSTGPVVEDASGNLILDPLKANFNYKYLNYNKVCSFFKVRTRNATVYDKEDKLYNNSPSIENKFLKLLEPKESLARRVSNSFEKLFDPKESKTVPKKEMVVYNKSQNKKRVLKTSNKKMIKQINNLFKSLPSKSGNYNSKSIKLPTKLRYGNLPIVKENLHHVTYDTPKFVLKIKDTKVAKINK